MTTKLQLISELSEHTVKQIASGNKEWTSFLNAAAQFYKYSFDDQILIYAQRPGAVACAPISTWNGRMKRWVNRGAKGIALIDKSKGRPCLKYVFDVTYTHPGQGAQEPQIWQMREEHSDSVIKTLEKTYGKSSGNFADRLMNIAAGLVEENYGDYTRELANVKSGSFLEELDELNTNAVFRDVLTASVQYILLSRCGVNTDGYLSGEDFHGISNFNTIPALSCIGSAASEISETVLRQIEHTIKVYNRRNKAQSIANQKDLLYNEFSTLKREKENYNGRINLHTSGRLYDSGFTDGRDAAGGHRQIRKTSGNISERTHERDIFGSAARGQAAAASAGNRTDSAGENRPDIDKTESAKRSDRKAEIGQPNGMGASDEQPDSAGGGNRTQRANIQLSLFPSENEQIEQIALAEDEKSSAFSIPQADINSVLLRGSGFENGKFHIYRQLSEPHSTKENIAFLKNEYGTGGFSHTFSDGKGGSGWYDSKGITISKYTKNSDKSDICLTWANAEKQLQTLVLASRYLTPDELEKYNEWLKVQQTEPFQTAAVRQVVSVKPAENADGQLTFTQMPVFTADTDREPPIDEMNNLVPDKPEEKAAGYIPTATKPEKINFRITDDSLGAGGKKTKYEYNIEAIRTLKQVEMGNRAAEPEEQQTLSKYVGWGGIPQAFDPENSDWAKEYAQLKELLTDDEYTAARASVLNAHYTSPTVIRSIYGALERMGFKTGNILEPAMGVGNFFGLVPESMQNSNLYGVELDSITGRIAKQLYPTANITVSGFEKTDFPNDFFDLGIGNVPFGDYKLNDRQYDKNNFLIHDYFFAKTLDKVRAGGIVAFITSKGTMDKQNPQVREYIASRADLLGAVRLPNNAFLKNAGTEVTSDIIFLQKRDHPITISSFGAEADRTEWVSLGETPDGIPVNRYFEEHPEMILGTMTHSERMYGNQNDTTCAPIENTSLEEQLKAAMANIELPDMQALDMSDLLKSTENLPLRSPLPANPNVRNFSYTDVNGDLYFRENSRMKPVDVSDTSETRIKGLIEIRDCTRKLIEYQMEDSGRENIQSEQKRLNILYDRFTEKYGLINSAANKHAFSEDSSYCLICSLEAIDENGNLDHKADMFTKRTIKQAQPVTAVETSSEALAVSIGEKACVDLPYMSELSGKSEQEITADLNGVIFLNPEPESGGEPRWENADEYLSGNVREKLRVAVEAAESDPALAVNAAALEKIQPKDLDASEIDVRLGAAWVDPEYIDRFMYELFQTPLVLHGSVTTRYSPVSGVWNIKGKNEDSRDNVLSNFTYGTKRQNAYSILEDSLNLKDVRIFDTVIDSDGKEQRVLNSKETAIAQQKQEAIRQEFRDWIWRDPSRREVLCKKYNETFNSTRPREYDGKHIRFVGINPEITLRPHQLAAVAHVLYGGNTLLAHCVGAGKTYEMAAAAMESKRLGLSQKALFVVPNHLTEQWGGDFLRLYPGANILVAAKKDFEPENRKKFCARIATGEYDAVIIGHSQFEKIPISKERQERTIQNQIFEITLEIDEAKKENGEKFTIKQMEKTKKKLESRLEKLNDTDRKDDVVTFEELGVDRLFVDEADSFKNLFLYTKMRNVAGIGQAQAQKSSDMFMKCRYMDELTGGRGITFATGTPVSNSMTELYTMMRYLQYDTLQKQGLGLFDSWAAAFGETVTAIELAPEGTGFRAKTRFARFFNLPELISMWKESADIQTADMLKLPIPEAEFIDVVTKPSYHQKEMVQNLAERAEAVRNRLVAPYEDNMLKITSDGRKLALDQRLQNELLPDDQGSKVNVCVGNILKIWQDTEKEHGAQLVFCDLSTPHYNGKFNIYDDIKNKLMAQGIPEKEIAFIHDAKTEVQKAELFAKVRKGQVRVLMGSTSKMGAGTNVQDRLVALHHIDCPWKPRDIEQREGRILRQGNSNEKVKIFRYVTEGTFDAYNWSLIENKQKFIGQVMTSKSPARSCEDIDETALSYAEVKALATGDSRIKEKMDLDIQVAKLKMLKANHQSQQYRLEDNLAKHFPGQIQKAQEQIKGLEADIKRLQEFPQPTPDSFSMIIKGMRYTDKKIAGTALIKACKEMKDHNATVDIGEYRGFTMRLWLDKFSTTFMLTLKSKLGHTVKLGIDPLGNTTRINNALEAMPKFLIQEREQLETLNRQTENAKEEILKPFPQNAELKEKAVRLNFLNAALSGDKKEEPQSEIPETEDLKKNTLSEKLQYAKDKSQSINGGEKGMEQPLEILNK